MENHSDTDSLDDWVFITPVDPQVITMVSVPTSPESNDERSEAHEEVDKEIEIRVSESTAAGGDKEEVARRVLPSWEWGGAKWREGGRKMKKKQKESDEVPFKEIIEALIRNSGEKVEEEEGKSLSCVEMLKSMGLKFP